MRNLITLFIAGALAFGFNACASDDGDETPTPECAASADCDDSDPCTVDSCDTEAGTCAHDAKSCDDSDECTADSCDAATGDCANEAKSCEDDDKCTNDSCDAATGDCANEAKTCDDGDPCTTDSCDAATGECATAAADDGTACDDGFASTTDDVCTAGVCAGMVTAEATMFRVNEITLVSPEITYELAGTPTVVNDLIGSLMTAELGEGDWEFLFSVLPLEPGLPATFQFGEGGCDYTGDDPTACSFDMEGRQATFPDVDQKAEGTCGPTDEAAPCFVSGEGQFSLSDIDPAHFGADLPEVDGIIFGAFAGDPIDTINGLVEGFLPKTTIEGSNLSFTVGETTLTATEFVGNIPTETVDGVEGWTLRLGVVATKVDGR